MSTSGHLSSSSTLQEIDVLCSPLGSRPLETLDTEFSPVLRDVTCGRCSIASELLLHVTLHIHPNTDLNNGHAFTVESQDGRNDAPPCFLLRFGPFISHLDAASFAFTADVNKELPSNLT